MGYVTRYFGGGPVLFELYLKDSSMLHDAPNETFAGLISSLNKFGFNLTGRACIMGCKPVRSFDYH